MTESSRPRPQLVNLNVFHDLTTYRLPLAGLVSILHRASGFLLVLPLPLVIWLFDKSISSELSYGDFQAAFTIGLWIFPAWFIKLVVWAIITAYVFHLLAGLRHLVLDVTHRMTKPFGRHTAAAVIIITVVLSLALGAKLFGLY